MSHLILGIITALGGGIVRDVLVNKIPFALLLASDIITALTGVFIAGVAYQFVKTDFSNRYFVLIPDALGLAAFTSTGAIVSYEAGVSGCFTAKCWM